MSAPAAPRVGVVGLGSMGDGMARSLLRAGIATWGFDVAAERVAAFAEAGGRTGELATVAAELDALVLVVVNAAQTEAVLFGEAGCAHALRPGTVVMGCATVPPGDAEGVERRLAARGVHYLDAPISGGAAKAAAGELSVMASGTAEAFAAAQPLLDAMAAKVFRLGDAAGPASAMKMVNQLLAGVHIAAAAEAITFGLRHGLDPATTIDVIAECAGTSWMFENRGPHIRDGDYTPRSAVEIFVKDLGLVEDMARAARFSTPLAGAALQQFLAAAGAGHGREDDAAIAKIYARNAGLTLPGDDGA